ncbi:calcium/sodium antiporter [Amorphus sp. 3PC139-8]|uniref:calcium/sodium antiporter n=1 Tax=Amorphus sp. 3PC139-8 TaxID=2735676 RepID=UPI00345D4DD5
MIALEILVGVVGLLAGGEILVRGASKLAVRLGMSPLVVGVTVVGFGTSVPELVTCLEAAWRGAPGIAIGNIVGSNIANIMLILGVAALMRPFAVSRQAVVRDGGLVIATSLAFTFAALTGMLERWMGAVFVAGLCAYLVWLYFSEKQPSGEKIPVEGEPVPTPSELTGSWLLDLVLVVGGCALVVLGANFLVDGAVELARMFHVSEDVIGLSLVAVGTSLPELATSIVAAVRKQSEIALGNVLGSNVYNVLGIGGITALVHPIPVSASMLAFDFPVMVGVSVAMVLMVRSGARLSRVEGGVLLAAYAGYIGLLYYGVGAA